jgi:triosephosphate isomerase
MRNKVIAGNWKMNKDVFETADLINGLKKSIEKTSAEVIICPPFTSLVVAQQLLKGSTIKLGAQDVSVHDDGAYTGEISVKMLKSVGCEYVIVGHSERRQYFHESNDLINQKAKKVLASGMKSIICVGETLDEREKGITDKVITAQVKGVLAGLTKPIWTG